MRQMHLGPKSLAYDVPTTGQRRAWIWLRHRWFWYAMAVVITAISLLLRMALQPLIGQQAPFLLFFATVLAVAGYGGLAPGLLATVLGGAAAYIYFPESSTDTVITHSQLLLYLFEGVLLSLLGARLHRTLQQSTAIEQANLQLEQQILEISDEERRRIGHDLHDGLGQQLTGIALLGKVLRHQLESRGDEVAGTADQIAQLVNQSIGWTRDLARGLSPVGRDGDALDSAIEEAAANSGRILQINCSFSCQGTPVTISQQIATHLYRIVQEAMNNSVKHGKAKNIEVRLTFEPGQIRLMIIDDGIGFSAKTMAHPGLGLRIMQYRARMIGANIAVQRASEEGGTIVRCSLPIANPAHSMSK